MNDSSGKSASGLSTLVVMILAAIVVAVMWGGWNRGKGSFESLRDMGRDMALSSTTPTVCSKSSKDGRYSFTDSDGTVYVFAFRVQRGDKWLTPKEAYGVFEVDRAYRVRVGRIADTFGSPRVFAIQSASRSLKAKKC